LDKLISPPAGLTDAEESEWWYERREIVEAEFSQAFAEGRVKRRTPEDFERQIEARRSAAPAGQSSIELEAADAKKAQDLAARKGVSYQTYVRMLVHQALEREPDAA
jgi:hypothetical protein